MLLFDSRIHDGCSSSAPLGSVSRDRLNNLSVASRFMSVPVPGCLFIMVSRFAQLSLRIQKCQQTARSMNGSLGLLDLQTTAPDLVPSTTVQLTKWVFHQFEPHCQGSTLLCLMHREYWKWTLHDSKYAVPRRCRISASIAAIRSQRTPISCSTLASTSGFATCVDHEGHRCSQIRKKDPERPNSDASVTPESQCWAKIRPQSLQEHKEECLG